MFLLNASSSAFSLLNKRGPIPISKIASELSDEEMEEAAASGGIVEVLKRRNDVRIISIKKSIHIAMVKDIVQHVDNYQKEAVYILLALVSAMTYLPNAFTNARGPIIPTHESLFGMAMTEGFTSRFDCADSVHRVIHRYPALFRIERNGRVRFTHTSDPPVKRPQKQVIADLDNVPAALTSRQTHLLKALRDHVPESFYISLHEWLTLTVAFWRSLPLEDLLGRLQELQSCDPPRIDVRRFGDSKEHIFIRILGRQNDGFSEQEEEEKKVFEKQRHIFAMGKEVIRILEGFLKENPSNYIASIKGLSMSQISLMLPERLRQNILAIFYGSQTQELQPNVNACILLFDRFRHVFDVQFSSGLVRLWSTLASQEQPSTLTWESCPLPLVLRHFLKSLSASPLSFQDLFDRLTPPLQWQLRELYSGNEDAEASSDGGAAAVQLFVSQHSMFLFAAQDGLVYTPQLVISQKSRKKTNISDGEKAQTVFNALPETGAVDLMSFLAGESGRQFDFPTKSISESFLSRYPNLFRLYSPFASHRTVVGRVGAPPPPDGLLNPSFATIHDVIKFTALHAVGGVTESTVVNNMSKDGRALVKRFGTLTEIVEQLPMWFDVRKDKFNSGASLITYLPSVGNTAQHAGAEEPLKLVYNDRRARSKREEDWNDDWDEESPKS